MNINLVFGAEIKMQNPNQRKLNSKLFIFIKKTLFKLRAWDMASGYYAAAVRSAIEIDEKEEEARTSVEPSPKKTKIAEIPVPSETLSLPPLNTGPAISIISLRAGPANPSLSTQV